MEFFNEYALQKKKIKIYHFLQHNVIFTYKLSYLTVYENIIL